MRKNLKKLLLPAIAFGICSWCNAAEFPLAANGKSNTLIHFDANATRPEMRAVAELQSYLGKITGAKDTLRVVNPAEFFRMKGKSGYTEILLATLANGKLLIPGDMYSQLEKASSDEAFYIRTDPADKRIIIAGKKPVGVLYGTYTFLEKYLGVRWFHPGPDGEYIPKKPELKLGDINDFQEPDFSGRTISCWEMSVKPWKLEDVRVWLARNKVQYAVNVTPNPQESLLDTFACGNKPLSGGGGHMTFENAIPKYLFKDHPEYFPMVDGKRVCEDRSQRCLANPEVRKMLVDYASKILPYTPEYMVSFNDSTYRRGNWCQCPECIKMGTSDGKFQISNLAHRFTSEIANEILKVHPEAIISVEIYSEFRDLPTDPSIRYDKRVLGRYCPHQRCYVHNFDDPKCDYNAKLYKLFLDWKEICPRMELFDFYSYSSSPYAPMEYTLGHDLKLYKKHKLDQWFEDCTNKDLQILSSNWPFYYVASKMTWDSSLDAEKLLNEAYDIYYGAAREPMKKYQAYRRELWEGAPGHALYGGPKRIAYCLTVPGAEKRLKDFLAEADKLAVNDPVLKRRIAADRNYLETYWAKEANELKKVMAGQNNIPAQETGGKIVIDGKLNEEDWRKAELIIGFLTSSENNKPGAPVEETRTKILYDKDNWYIGIEAMTEHAWAPVKAQIKKHDGSVWTDDCIEVFIVPPDNSADYYQWVVNSAGVYYDAKARSPEFESNAEVKTTVFKDRYVIEMRIPASSMNLKMANGQEWRIHLSRTCQNLQPPKSLEESSLDGITNPNPALFRRAIIGKNIMRNGNFAEIVENKNLKARFPHRWGGNKVTLIEGEHNRNQIELQNGGYLASYVGVPVSAATMRLSGTVTASGNGTLNIWLDSWVRAPGDNRPAKNEIKRRVEPIKLDKEMKTYPFQLKLKPYEDGSLFFQVVEGTARISGVGVVVNAEK